MVENRGFAVGASAIALIHSNHVHAGGQPLGGKACHILRLRGTFESVNDNDGECGAAVGLPVAVAQGPDAGLDFHQMFLARRKQNAAVDEEAGDGLRMSAAQPAARYKPVLLELSLRSHCN